MSRFAALFLTLAALNGLAAVLAGAWASHGFLIPLAPDGDFLAETGSRYQMWHALALLGAVLLHDRLAEGSAPQWLCRLAGLLFVFGISGFCGGLYAAAAGGRLPGLAPLGGLALMAAWLALAASGGLALARRQ